MNHSFIIHRQLKIKGKVKGGRVVNYLNVKMKINKLIRPIQIIKIDPLNLKLNRNWQRMIKMINSN